MDYFFKTTNFYGYTRGQFKLICNSYGVSHSCNNNNYYMIDEIGTGFSEYTIRKVLFSENTNYIIKSWDGYRILNMTRAKQAASYIQRVVRKYLKRLKWRRVGMAVMEILTPILYHPKSPYMLKVFESENYDKQYRQPRHR